jgi:hypothetical protein
MPLLSGNPVSASGQVTIMAGDDYFAADGRALVFTNVPGNWPDLTGAKVYFVASAGNFPPQQPSTVPLPLSFPAALIAPILGSVVTPSGANQAVQFELPALNTGVRPSPSPTDLYAYAIYAVLADNHLVTLQTGPLQVLGVSA